MTFSNAAGAAAGAAPTYVRALLDVLGRRDPTEVLGELLPWLSAGFLLRLMGAHDLVHRRQIDRILSAVAARR